jgi:hypothetical protein
METATVPHIGLHVRNAEGQLKTFAIDEQVRYLAPEP